MTLRKATSYEQFQWMRHKINPDDPGLTLRYRFAIDGAIDFQRLDSSLREVVASRFGCLLGYFFERDGELFVGCNSLQGTVVERVTDVSEWDHVEPVDPSGDKLFRFACFVDNEKVTALQLEFSHMVFDGACYRPFLDAFSESLEHPESACDAVGQKVAAGFLAVAEVPVGQESVDYWTARLKGARLFRALPFCYRIPKERGVYLSVKRTLGQDFLVSVSKTLARMDTTLFQFLVAVTGAVVRLYSTAEEDDDGRVTMSHTVNCRNEQQAFGCYTNLVPLFLVVDPARSGSSLIAHVKEARQDVRKHQYVPVQHLIQWADAEANRHGRLFNLVVNCSDGLMPYATPDLAGCHMVLTKRPDTGGQNDVAINYSFDGQQLFLSFDSSSRFLSGETLRALADNFVRVAAFIATSPERPLHECAVTKPLTPVIRGDRDDAAPHVRVLERFLTESGLRPDEPAVSDGQAGLLTYRQLHAAVGHLYRDIVTHADIPPGAAVGIFLERTVALPAACLGVMASQRTFVPMDPLLPDERLVSMLDVSNIGIMLVDSCTCARAATLFPGVPVVDVPACLEAAMTQPGAGGGLEQALMLDAQPDATAYVMFTSGSTGKPKGVAISERNLANFLASMRVSPGFRAGERMLALTPVSFDISILELLLPLVCGGSLHVVSDQVRMSADLLGDVLNQGQVDVVQATPSTWRMLQQAGWHASGELRILCGGEALDRDLAQYLLEQTGHLYNMYGPTEATIWAGCCRVTEAGRVSLGHPVLNSAYYVLDSGGNSVVPGMRGELMIAGECVGKGYLNAPSEPAFVMLPDGVRGYKTGDIVHYLSHRNIEYVGRLDSQCKVNGYRVDTGEVSQCIKAFASDVTVFTVVRNKPEPHLCCFVQVPDAGGFDTEQALQWCRQTLPYYMVPKAIHCLATVPLTANGKADVKRLGEAPVEALPLVVPSPPVSRSRSWVRPQEKGIQQEIRDILRESLGVSASDPDQPLGWLGLNSISYNLLSAAIQKRFNIVFRSYEFYQFNTINEVAEAICQRQSPDQAVRTEKAGVVHHPDGTADARLAIVGMAATLPGGDDVATFWRALLDRKDCIAVAPADRAIRDCRAGFISSVRGFDARFFSISPLEASRMDPRQRLLLQAAWKALEDAGYAPSRLSGGRIGCYMAAAGGDYALLQARDNEEQTPYSLSGHSLSMLANRLSVFFDWNGPSFTLDTACSGALTALVKACRDLQSRVCDAAMVGGINLILDAQVNQGLEAGRFMSPDSRCATFDERANGYVRGEGYGCFFVKRLRDAQADGDLVHAVIENVAENHGGRANSLTSPNPNAQYRLLLDAYTPDLARRVSYIETHGTGTRLGDPVEVAALKRAFQERVDPGSAQKIWLGAVKSNIGHLEPAAGVASMVKVIKAFEHGHLPANLHFQRLNPEIDLSSSPFRVLADSVSWQGEEPLTAGVSSFGFGGTNAHVVLSAPFRQDRRSVIRYDRYLIPVSARTGASLMGNMAALEDFVAGHCAVLAECGLADLAFALSCGREHFEHRQAWLVSGVDDLLLQLRSRCSGVHVPQYRQIVADVVDPGELDDPEMLEHTRVRYLEGCSIDWWRLYEGSDVVKMRLPTYRFDERAYWYARD
ncbi:MULTISPECIES: beta-ketoacyl synthase N-terminal-like domain-containing protein [unclassified Haematospirillum]|uniref:beta-ketoacyl synthase N-terminal-like domain-containing protein n=1 Tax=unclassified Haematospirillum TaxID=2622088 RepID=UPI001439B14C|nr:MULTISPECIES: beta-ketoacyl synthase N-terminal-like domain-containing protein [unclassified Haematospirillum]NKD55173.1 AMP-binding protein [Haematospirillum sp. H4890]NKD75058.1 AMP-binding protein [Haematospirillum sp. H4485]